MRDVYFEDLVAGFRFTTGGVTLTESEIIDFALKYDPQFFHLDREAAAASAFGGLVASGMQVLALSFRLAIDSGMLQHNLGGNAADDVRWRKPVVAGDTIRVAGEVLEARPLESRPDRGVVRIRYATTNQRGDAVLEFILVHFVSRRPTH